MKKVHIYWGPHRNQQSVPHGGERRQELPRRLSGAVSTFVTSLPNAKVIDSDSFLTIYGGVYINTNLLTQNTIEQVD